VCLSGGKKTKHARAHLSSPLKRTIFKKEKTRSERKLKEIAEEVENARSCLCVKATGGAGETPLVSLEMKRGPVEVEVSNEKD